MNILPLGAKDKCAEPGDELPETQVPHHHFLAKEQEWAAESDGSLRVNDPVRLECSGYKEITAGTYVRTSRPRPQAIGPGAGQRSTFASVPGHALGPLFSLPLTPCEFTLRRHPQERFARRDVLASQTPTENRSSAPPPRASQPSRVSFGKRVRLRRLALRDERVCRFCSLVA